MLQSQKLESSTAKVGVILWSLPARIQARDCGKPKDQAGGKAIRGQFAL
jgi:hypothetical protein